jgi:hypothetical protein
VPADVFALFGEQQPVDLFLSQTLHSISEYREIYVGWCMAERGFPEVLEADALVDDESSGWGEWHVESGLFGPDTSEQALQHGYLDREWWGGGDEPPKLVSSDPEFLSAADECGQEWDSALPVAGLYQEYSGDTRNRVSEAMYQAMESVDVEATEVFNEWLGCIETAGFTRAGAEPSFGFGIEAEGGGGLTTYFGVEVGDWEGGRDLDTSALPAGTTEIRQGGSRGVYVPTDAEVALATADVACKEEVHFWQRLFPFSDIQRRAMAPIREELLQLNPEIEALAGRAQSLAEQRALASELVAWPPPIPVVEVPDGATWPCPPVGPQVSRILDAADVPDEIRYLPPAGDTYHVDAAWGVDYGPTCRRPPALVAVAFDAEDRSSADAVVGVWVEAPGAVLGPPADPAGGPPVAEPHEELAATVNLYGFVVRYHPGTEWMTERVEMVGVIDGLPVLIQASGMTPGELSALSG